MGVDFMEFYKDFLLTILEMIFAIFIIIFGYMVWDTFDQTNYEQAKLYSKTKEVLIDVDYKDTYSILYLHNISGEDNNKTLSFKINKDNEYIKNNVILYIDNNFYELSNLNYIEDEYFRYYNVDNINFKGYETKEYNFKILLKEEINNNYLNYEFVTNL